jgi:RNA polymerase sigma-70 factor (ECF subfamily)
VGLRPEVEDLVQNTLVRVHSSLNDLRKPDRLMGFVMKAALFELHDFYRGRYSAKEELFDPEQPPEDGENDTRAGDRIDLDRAIDSLTERARHILALREYGYRYREIADMLDTSEAAVKMQVKRAFERLRKLLVA